MEYKYKREAVACIVTVILGWFWVGIILEPLALWRGIYVASHTEDKVTMGVATVAAIMAGVTLSILVGTIIISLLMGK